MTANSDLGRQSTVELLTLHPDLQIYKSRAILLSTPIPCTHNMAVCYCHLYISYYGFIYTLSDTATD